MLQADEGEGAGEDFPAGPAETLAEPEGGRAPEHLTEDLAFRTPWVAGVLQRPTANGPEAAACPIATIRERRDAKAASMQWLVRHAWTAAS
eukprot:scaffold77078_cov31-Tisochrysis_lutea.AAC.2